MIQNPSVVFASDDHYSDSHASTTFPMRCASMHREWDSYPRRSRKGGPQTVATSSGVKVRMQMSVERALICKRQCISAGVEVTECLSSCTAATYSLGAFSFTEEWKAIKRVCVRKWCSSSVDRHAYLARRLAEPRAPGRLNFLLLLPPQRHELASTLTYISPSRFSPLGIE